MAINNTKSINIFQMDIKYTNIFHLKALQNLPKYGIFGFENVPSGNPALEPEKDLKELQIKVSQF
jgi:hypothetical protein